MSETSVPKNSVCRRTSAWAKSLDLRAIELDSIPSTNDFAKTQDLDNDFCLVLTEHQTCGRGRGTHSWTDLASGAYLLSSWVFKSQTAVGHLTSPLVGLALFRASNRVWPHLSWSLKAPNDLWLKDKKVAGLLIEVISQDAEKIIIGLGLNVLGHPPTVPMATHIAEHEPRVLEKWEDFCTELWGEFKGAVQDATHPVLNEAHRHELLFALNRNPALSERYSDVEPSGHLHTATRRISWLEL